MARIRDFHRHAAPGLAIGVKMVTMAMEQMEEGILFDVVCETRSCLPDAVQMLSPLYSEREFQEAMPILSRGPVLNVLLLKQAHIGILITGTEIFQGP